MTRAWWPFCKCDAEQRVAGLMQERDEAWDAYSAVVESKGTAEIAMANMRKALTDEGVAEISRGVASQIADIYAAGGRGVRERDIAVHAVVATAVRRAATGEASWNEGQLAAKAYPR